MFKSNFSTHIVCKILIRLPAKHQRTQEVLEYAVYRLSYPAACTQHVQYRHNISDAIAISNRQSFRTYFTHQPLDSLITQEEFSRAVSQQNLSQQIGQWVNDGKKNVLNLLTLYHQGIDHATFYEALEAFVYHHIKKQPAYKRQEWRNREINRTNYPDTYLAASEFINKRHIISKLSLYRDVEKNQLEAIINDQLNPVHYPLLCQLIDKKDITIPISDALRQLMGSDFWQNRSHVLQRVDHNSFYFAQTI